MSAGAGVDPVLHRDYRDMMSAFPTGVAVLAARDARGHPWGMTCSSLCSVNVDPPRLLVCVRLGSPTLAAMVDTGVFTVNLLHARAQQVAELFASGDPDRYERTSWRLTPSGAGPHLYDDAHSVAECRLHRLEPVGDHAVVVADVTDVLTAAPAAPLLYGLRRFHALPAGPGYASASRQCRSPA